MKTRRFIKWQLKQWFAPLLIAFLLLFLSFIITCSTSNVSYRYYEGGSFVSQPSSNLIAISIPLTLVAVIFPLFVYDYRFKKTQADTFMQAPLKRNRLRLTRLLLGLSMIMIIFTIVYVIGVLIVFFRQVTTPDLYEQGGYIFKIRFFDYRYYIAAYFFLLAFASLEYFISSFIVLLSDNVLDAIFLLLFVDIIRALLPFSFYTYSTTMLNNIYNGYNSFQGSWLANAASPLLVMLYPEKIFSSFIIGKEALIFTNFSDYVSFIFYLVAYLLMGVSSVIYVVLSSDPSGEYVGRPGPRRNIIGFIPHLTIFSIGLLTLSYIQMQPLAETIIFLVIALIYYCCLALYYRRFRLPRFAFISYFIVLSLVLLGTLSYYAADYFSSLSNTIIY